MRNPPSPSVARDQARRRVEAAILLVADGRYPTVVIANLADGDHIARELCAAATSRGVALSTARREAGQDADIVVRRR